MSELNELIVKELENLKDLNVETVVNFIKNLMELIKDLDEFHGTKEQKVNIVNFINDKIEKSEVSDETKTVLKLFVPGFINEFIDSDEVKKMLKKKKSFIRKNLSCCLGKKKSIRKDSVSLPTPK